MTQKEMYFLLLLGLIVYFGLLWNIPKWNIWNGLVWVIGGATAGFFVWKKSKRRR